MRRAWVAATALGTACGSSTPPAAPPPDQIAVVTAPPDAAPPPPDAAPPPPDAAPPDAPPPDAPPLAIPTDRPEVKGARVTIAQDEAATIGGRRVAYGRHRHKHYADGRGTTQIIPIEVTRGRDRASFELRGDDPVLHAELDALGALLVVEGNSMGIVVVLAAKRTPAPLDEDAAVALVEAEAERVGLPRGSGAGYAVEDGVLRYRTSEGDRPLWGARVGLYTRRVWFVEP